MLPVSAQPSHRIRPKNGEAGAESPAVLPTHRHIAVVGDGPGGLTLARAPQAHGSQAAPDEAEASQRRFQPAFTDAFGRITAGNAKPDIDAASVHGIAARVAEVERGREKATRSVRRQRQRVSRILVDLIRALLSQQGMDSRSFKTRGSSADVQKIGTHRVNRRHERPLPLGLRRATGERIRQRRRETDCDGRASRVRHRREAVRASGAVAQ
ncbi:hypothetical protein [Burkholderia lata]|uniref:hypothetical protein n=1 Tax=Burkholderia lata (strain ATCC 17760 / DSM 23089 / LMG 22485 / NCIMB 9086 / R18194 / 383) TaxID=482957 RepID=UPI0020C6A9B7|nr:hypothetical protein [Burkholderia lata]